MNYRTVLVDDEPLAGFHSIARLYEDTNDFPGHRRGNLPAALGFQSAVAPAAPRARIEDFGGVFRTAALKFQRSAGQARDAHFV